MAEAPDLACPGCGTGVSLDFEVACVTVCPSCLKLLERSDVGLRDLGRLGPLQPTRTRLKVGLRGRHDLKFFTVMGRVQMTESGGNVWDEFYAAFDGGAWGWLFEDSGRIHLSIAQERPGAIPQAREVRAGQALVLAGQRLTVTEVDVATAVAAEGEIPFHIAPGERYTFADLSGEGGAFGTIDYSFEPPRVYLGREIPFEAFRLDAELDRRLPDDREPPAPADPPCPSCAKPVPIRAFGETVCVVCPHCHALANASGRELQASAHSVPRLPSAADAMPLPLGATGTLRGEKLTVVAYRLRSVRKDGVRYPWHEVLLHAEKGYRYLDCANGHFTLGRTVAAGDVRSDGQWVRYKGERYERFSVGTPTTEHVAGEWPWRIAAESGHMTEYVCPPYMLAQESGAGEIDWTRSEHLPAHELKAAFPLLKAPPQRGVGATEPFRNAAIFRIWGFASLSLIMAYLAVLVFASPKNVLSLRVEVPPLSDGGNFTVVNLLHPQPAETFPMPATGQPLVVTSESFEARGGKNLSVTAQANVDNAWLFAAGEFLNEEEGDLQPFSFEVSYYHGVDGGESWSEGTDRSGTRVSAMPAGPTRLQLAVERDPADRRPVTLDVLVVEDDPNGANVFLALLLLALPALFTWIGRSSFERRRWEDSDFPKGES